MGEVPGWVADLEARWQGELERRRTVVGAREAEFELELRSGRAAVRRLGAPHGSREASALAGSGRGARGGWAARAGHDELLRRRAHDDLRGDPRLAPVQILHGNTLASGRQSRPDDRAGEDRRRHPRPGTWEAGGRTVAPLDPRHGAGPAQGTRTHLRAAGRTGRRRRLMLAQAARLLANFKSADLDRTISFYEGKLGFPVLHRREIMPGVEEVRFDSGGGVLCFELGDPQGKDKRPRGLGCRGRRGDRRRSSRERGRLRGVRLSELEDGRRDRQPSATCRPPGSRTPTGTCSHSSPASQPTRPRKRARRA